jgi:sugar transferase EpsL
LPNHAESRARCSKEACHSRQRGRRLAAKKILDRGIALCGLVILAPFLVGMGFVIALTMGWPVFFPQRRPGKFGKPFMLVKFRTMSDCRDTNGDLLPDSARLTRVGRFIRSTSFDEFPQLWNVLSGELSLVGPRPLLMDYLPRYSPEQARRHEVMPGITGWAQVNGRNALTWEEKFTLDVWYVDHWSMLLDLRILGLTLLKVIRRDGINQGGQATMREFTGSENADASHE